MSTDIDLSEDFDDTTDSPLLPPLDELYGVSASRDDLDFESMLAVATDPATPAMDPDLIRTADAADAAEAIENVGGEEPLDLDDPDVLDSFDPGAGLDDLDEFADLGDDGGDFHRDSASEDVAGHDFSGEGGL